MGTFRARNVAPDTPAATPVSITQSLSALRLKHAHLLGERHADGAAPSQREAEVADAQAREADARATGGRRPPPGHSRCGGPHDEG